MDAAPQWKCKTEPESRRPVFAVALVIVAGQAWVGHSLKLHSILVVPADLDGDWPAPCRTR